MLDVNDYAAVGLSGMALFISMMNFFTQRKNQELVHRLNWNKEMISWSSGVMEEIGNVLYIFEQLKHGASYEEVLNDAVVSKQNMKALLDFGRLLIFHVRQGNNKSGANWVYSEKKQRALDSVHAVYGRLCLIVKSGEKIDIDGNMLYISQCRRSFASEIQSTIGSHPAGHAAAVVFSDK